MKSFGHLNMQQNELQNAVLHFETAFPALPKVGQLAFVNTIVYVCVSADNSLPVWVPLTREITAYTHTQSSPASTWNVVHNLNTTSVQVQTFDAVNKMFIPGNVEIVDPNNVTVTIGSASAGKATVLTGHFDGLVKPTYAFTFYQSSSSASWVIVHNLGYNPIVRVFIGNNEVQPATIVHDSTNQVTVTFSTAQVGYVRCI